MGSSHAAESAGTRVLARREGGVPAFVIPLQRFTAAVQTPEVSSHRTARFKTREQNAKPKPSGQSQAVVET